MKDNDFYFRLSGGLIMFSFFSIVSIFITLIFIGTTNNYAIYSLYNTSKSLIASGVVTPVFDSTIDTVSGGITNILPYIDYLWFISFILICVNSVVFSYHSKRQNYFSIFTFAVFGIMIFVYIGSFFIEVTSWFQSNVLNAVFPTYSAYFPFFSWYLDNLSIINIILIVLIVIANFVDINFSKFNNRKSGDLIEEI